ncbi:MAG: hypothetical protein IPG74_03320 [Flavobacteriales bacterium]|nr:hypothetical protein [Flavobacteriales bacterium]
MLAPDRLRPAIEALIDAEAIRARRGQQASILLKLNSLEDKSLISKLYHAGRAGVGILHHCARHLLLGAGRARTERTSRPSALWIGS